MVWVLDFGFWIFLGILSFSMDLGFCLSLGLTLSGGFLVVICGCCVCSGGFDGG